mgnify:CR=1 FL=1
MKTKLKISKETAVVGIVVLISGAVLFIQNHTHYQATLYRHSNLETQIERLSDLLEMTATESENRQSMIDEHAQQAKEDAESALREALEARSAAEQALEASGR